MKEIYNGQVFSKIKFLPMKVEAFSNKAFVLGTGAISASHFPLLRREETKGVDQYLIILAFKKILNQNKGIYS